MSHLAISLSKPPLCQIIKKCQSRPHNSQILHIYYQKYIYLYGSFQRNITLGKTISFNIFIFLADPFLISNLLFGWPLNIFNFGNTNYKHLMGVC